MISYPELLTFRTAGFTKWFAESFLAYWGLSKKELDVKLSSGKGIGKSDGIRREEVLAFLSGEKHKIGFLGDQGVISSKVVREVPGEALKQLEMKEAELDTWMQATQRRASVEFTSKSRPSSEGSSGKPDSDNGAVSFRKSTRRSKMKRSQCLKGRDEDSPNVEVPLTIIEEVPGNADEPPEKRNREEETIGEEDEDLVTPEVPTDKAVMDPVVAPEEGPRDSGVIPESPTADLPHDSDDFEPSMDANADDASDEFMEEESVPAVVEEGCEVTGKIPSFSSEPEQGVPEVDPEIWTPTTSSDIAEARPPGEIPSLVAPIGKSSFITLPTGHGMSSRSTEKGESSSDSSLRFAKNVLARVLSSWIETLLSGLWIPNLA